MSLRDDILAVRSLIEEMYEGRCDIVEHRKVKKANKSTGFEDVTVVASQPCRLSFSSLNATAEQESLASSQTQVIKLFMAPEVTVPSGCKIVVTQNGATTEYKASGYPAMHENHQEIVLVLFDGWA